MSLLARPFYPREGRQTQYSRDIGSGRTSLGAISNCSRVRSAQVVPSLDDEWSRRRHQCEFMTPSLRHPTRPLLRARTRFNSAGVGWIFQGMRVAIERGVIRSDAGHCRLLPGLENDVQGFVDYKDWGISRRAPLVL
jgi:hypothetical protein